MDWISCPNCDWMFPPPPDAAGNRITCPYCKGIVALGPATAPPASRPAAPQSSSVQPASTSPATPAQRPGCRARSDALEGPAPSARGPELPADSRCPHSTSTVPSSSTAPAAPAARLPTRSSAVPARVPSRPPRRHGPHLRRRPHRGWTGLGLPWRSSEGCRAGRALPWIVGGGILTVLIVMAVSFTRGPRPGGAEAEADAKPAIATVLDEAKPPEAGAIARGTVLDEAKPPDAAPPPEATEPDPTIAWRDAPLPSASEDPDAPILLVQLHSLDRLFADLKAVGEVAGLSKPINDLLALLAVNGGAGGLPGIPCEETLGRLRRLPTRGERSRDRRSGPGQRRGGVSQTPRLALVPRRSG